MCVDVWSGGGVGGGVVVVLLLVFVTSVPVYGKVPMTCISV